MDHIMFTQQKIHVKIDRTQCRNCDRKQILFFIFHSYILYLLFEVIEFFKFSYLLFVYTGSFLLSDKNEYWILK